MTILQIPTTKDQIKRAQDLADEMGTLKNSITKGKGNVLGFLGEVVLADHFGWKQSNTYNYDLLMPNGKTVDVKSKQCRSIPLPHYECSIASYNIKQQCDYYAFNRIKSDLSVVYFAGMLPKGVYFDKATKRSAGEVDESNGFTFRADCYNLEIAELDTEGI